MSTHPNHEAERVVDAVRAHYGELARAGVAENAAAPSCGCDCDCGGDVGTSAAAPAGYDTASLSHMPADAFSLGCGDPARFADLAAGEHVLDLGSGAGLDCFLAARAVGATGRVIGVDMTPEMLERARANDTRLRSTDRDLAPIAFRHGRIEDLPVDAASIDVILSNCVINLAPDKAPVFREMYRVLRPGGRVRVSDLVREAGAAPPLPSALPAAGAEQSWCACVEGALTPAAFEQGLRSAGFEDIRVVITGDSLTGPSNEPNAENATIRPAMIYARKPTS